MPKFESEKFCNSTNFIRPTMRNSNITGLGNFLRFARENCTDQFDSICEQKKYRQFVSTVSATFSVRLFRKVN